MRLTYKNEKRYEPSAYNLGEQIITKLGQLEDIEEELGIDLATLFKALKNEYVFIKQDGEIHESNAELPINKDGKGWHFDLSVCHFGNLYFKDYGKTWALSKEELHNGI